MSWDIGALRIPATAYAPTLPAIFQMRLETLNKELEDIFSTVEYEEDGGIHITGTDWYSDDLRIDCKSKEADVLQIYLICRHGPI